MDLENRRKRVKLLRTMGKEVTQSKRNKIYVFENQDEPSVHLKLRKIKNSTGFAGKIEKDSILEIFLSTIDMPPIVTYPI